METKQTKYEIIAESYINGNISLVKQKTKRKDVFIKVLQVIKELYPNSEESFIRINS